MKRMVLSADEQHRVNFQWDNILSSGFVKGCYKIRSCGKCMGDDFCKRIIKFLRSETRENDGVCPCSVISPDTLRNFVLDHHILCNEKMRINIDGIKFNENGGPQEC